ncbi:TetR/AcrR family transcriptional regulator [Litchfieldia salsa]|uniref:DNA-binding transcriptional regulator, AcrR family n=1 Tax=Litchfieldia salsa TaxID=930152 RepID=A0A1H0VPU4_9BACI|nr:TetR/AcrR family transcriptional regulator [Litchfieldia salsa]SDP80547.1 DNA-binding transcriptional regulator, AcrR family [Litchfieldia salsa]
MLREERKKELKKQIFFKSIELFKEYGYDNVTVEKITSSCGIAKGTFFNYFPKKEHVLLYLGNSQNDYLQEIAQKHKDVKIKQQLLLIFKELLSVYLENSDLLKLTLSETIRSALNDESRNIYLFKETVTTLIEEAKTNKTINTRFDSKTIASVLVGIYFNTLIIWSISNDESVDIISIFERQYEVVWEGVEQQLN